MILSYRAPDLLRNVLDLVAIIEQTLPGGAEVRESGAPMAPNSMNGWEGDTGRTLPNANSEMAPAAPGVAETVQRYATLLDRQSEPSRSVSRRSADLFDTNGPRLRRDRAIVLHVVRCRLLSYTQLHALVFSGKHRAVVGRRIRALEADGWLRTWEERVARGGHPRYALPTKKALHWTRHVFLDRSRTTVREQLLSTMLRDSSPSPLELEESVIPKQLAHQRETNDIVLALLRSNLPISWVSTWHRPFPNEAAHLALPQPDAVAVMNDRLVFIEHDRGHEAPEAFRRAKAERYAALHTRPDILQALTGFQSFDVVVTVHAPAPLERVRTLQQVVRTTYGSSMFRFTLASWLIEAPHEAICFDGFSRPETTDSNRTAHRELRPLPAIGSFVDASAGET